MPDARKHRGRDPADQALFAPAQLAVLRTAVAELSWLLGRGYSQNAAVTLVGDHHSLKARQRLAILRSAASDGDRDARQARRIAVAQVRGQSVAVDGLNCLITVEAALSGGLLLRGRDGVLRDLASVHGNYRLVAETEPAIAALGQVLAAAEPTAVHVFLDRPVSNSGRLRALMETMASGAGWPWQVSLVDNPDRAILARAGWITASGDAPVLDRCGPWVPLADAAVAAVAPSAWLIELG
jgi:hypothetical protein